MTAKRISMSLPKKILLWGGAIFLLLLVIGAFAPPEEKEVSTKELVQGASNKVKEVTYTDGKENGRKRVSEQITQEPVDKVKKIGTKVAAAPKPAPKPSGNCDANYSGCVPIASDVDCADGSGNGPAYARGPIRVLGYDKYGLDADDDGIACE